MANPELQKLMHANILEVFSERDAEKRREAIARVYNQDAVANDEEGQTVGTEALDKMIEGLQANMPGLTFTPDGDTYELQDGLYQPWTLGPVGGGDPVGRGADFAFVSNGKISRVYTIVFH